MQIIEKEMMAVGVVERHGTYLGIFNILTVQEKPNDLLLQRILLFIAIGVLLFAPSVGIALLSYVGAYVTVIFNRQQNP